jgi:hypothetical protein
MITALLAGNLIVLLIAIALLAGITIKLDKIEQQFGTTIRILRDGLPPKP